MLTPSQAQALGAEFLQFASEVKNWTREQANTLEIKIIIF
jgi:hypothetical protein